MVRGIIGRKIGMTQLFEGGEEVAVTAIEAGPCFVTQIKTEANDGYNAVQLGFGETKRLNKAEKGHLKDMGQLQHLREFAVEDTASVKVGQKIDVDIFKAGDRVSVIGISKGKGFAGGVKRHHFRGGPKTHGQSDRHRAPGSVGATTSPGRVWKGQRMAGHMGNIRSTERNLRIVKVDPARHLLIVEGAVPGHNKGLLLINKAG
ncbi:MAG: 50S ribosomal protein L3 [Chloroflexi bacterium]|nr:50S ribosomal protein L3 [Chloroflexota bacterium]MBM3154298.1 50S ribosomal protein L3 [Chloroflexota bacterium]MBM3172947.1 50S ribosomal protein L3 [Chloroflexota bacterium]MBM3174492.1 50S ribosomal protein L3 [Chloroflexota bacterium]MBM4449558.1 50S ribosomal protein L3 [Chloroflexota bacterium]